MISSAPSSWRPLQCGAAFALVSLLLLAGCGRKGPLFLPQEKLQDIERSLERREPASPTPPAQSPAPGDDTASDRPLPAP